MDHLSSASSGDGPGAESSDINKEVAATWIIFFHDQDRQPEMFTTEAAARARYEQCRLAWTCDLFVHESELRQARADLRGFRGALMEQSDR